MSEGTDPKKEQHQITAAKGKKKVVATPPPLPADAYTSDKLPPMDDEDATKFMRRIFDAQVRGKLHAGRSYCSNLPSTDLRWVVLNGKKTDFRLHHTKVELFQTLYKAIQAAHQDPNSIVDGISPSTCKSVGLASAYRTVEEDAIAWRNAFDTHFDATERDRVEADGGEYGKEAFLILLTQMNSYKAPPGFSNHTRGIAVDFKTVLYQKNKNGKNLVLGARSAQKPLWRKTWLFKWLKENAKLHGFTTISKEEWHWEHAK